MEPGRDRELLCETLGESYRVETTTRMAIFEADADCCVFDRLPLVRAADAALAERADADDVFLPFVLLADSGATDSSGVWEHVDDVITLPAGKAELRARIDNLVARRQAALDLAERTAQLEAIGDDYRLQARAIGEAPIGFTITDPDRDGNPFVFVNDHFETLTGYDEAEIVGRSCRFLRGEDTDPQAGATIREAVEAERPATVNIRNYRKNGRPFWNRVTIAPVHDNAGDLTNYVGFQVDVTERKIKGTPPRSVEPRSQPQHAEQDERDRGPPRTPLGGVRRRTVTRIARGDRGRGGGSRGIADTVRNSEEAIPEIGSGQDVIDLGDRLETLVSGFENRFPAVRFDLALPTETTIEVAVPEVVTAVEEAIENAVEHNDDSSPAVAIRVEKRADGWIAIEIEDNGPGIPAHEVDVLDGGETPLHHADRLGFWLIHWIVSKAGGDFSVADADPTGSVLTISVPASGERSAS
jgi:PAS domain S-box-containing protein